MDNSAQMAMQNMQMRAALLATGIRAVKDNGTYVETSMGRSTRVKIFNTGILTKLNLFVSAAVTIGTATAVPSTRAPWNLINRVRLSDFDGADRINMSGFQAFILNCLRRRVYYGGNNGSGTAVLTNPNVGTAVGAAVIQFHLEIPVAYDVDNPIVQLQDLRGAMLIQTGIGEIYLTIDWNTSLYTNNDVESVYAGAGTTTVVLAAGGISLSVWQEYIIPQNVNGLVPIPQMDIMTVYELNGFTKSTDNLAVGTEKFLSYPNQRSVIGAYFNYVQAGTQTANKVTKVRVIGNGNAILVDRLETLQLMYQRNLTDGDTIAGAYFISNRDKPVETAIWGNMQIGVTPNTVGATPYIEQLWESFYTKGQMLPGVQQGN